MSGLHALLSAARERSDARRGTGDATDRQKQIVHELLRRAYRGALNTAVGLATGAAVAPVLQILGTLLQLEVPQLALHMARAARQEEEYEPRVNLSADASSFLDVSALARDDGANDPAMDHATRALADHHAALTDHGQQAGAAEVDPAFLTHARRENTNAVLAHLAHARAAAGSAARLDDLVEPADVAPVGVADPVPDSEETREAGVLLATLNASAATFARSVEVDVRRRLERRAIGTGEPARTPPRGLTITGHAPSAPWIRQTEAMLVAYSANERAKGGSRDEKVRLLLRPYLCIAAALLMLHLAESETGERARALLAQYTTALATLGVRAAGAVAHAPSALRARVPTLWEQLEALDDLAEQLVHQYPSVRRYLALVHGAYGTAPASNPNEQTMGRVVGDDASLVMYPAQNTMTGRNVYTRAGGLDSSDAFRLQALAAMDARRASDEARAAALASHRLRMEAWERDLRERMQADSDAAHAALDGDDDLAFDLASDRDSDDDAID